MYAGYTSDIISLSTLRLSLLKIRYDLTTYPSLAVVASTNVVQKAFEVVGISSPLLHDFAVLADHFPNSDLLH